MLHTDKPLMKQVFTRCGLKGNERELGPTKPNLCNQHSEECVVFCFFFWGGGGGPPPPSGAESAELLRRERM